MSASNMVKSVVKAMKIIEKLVEKKEATSLSAISREVKMNISTVHRLLNTFLVLGYVEQDEQGLYKLGFGSYKLAEKINENFDIKQLVHPYLREIVSECNETTNLVVLEDYQVVYIDQVESTNMVRMFAGVGNRGPAYCTGAGKVLLAYLPEQEQQKYLREIDLVSYTENTITVVEKLMEEFRKIRRQGFALDLEEKEQGVRCAAAPIFGINEEAVGAISVSGPSSRLTIDYLKETVIPLICNRTKEITSNLQINNRERQ